MDTLQFVKGFAKHLQILQQKSKKFYLCLHFQHFPLVCILQQTKRSCLSMNSFLNMSNNLLGEQFKARRKELNANKNNV